MRRIVGGDRVLANAFSFGTEQRKEECIGILRCDRRYAGTASIIIASTRLAREQERKNGRRLGYCYSRTHRKQDERTIKRVDFERLELVWRSWIGTMCPHLMFAYCAPIGGLAEEEYYPLI